MSATPTALPPRMEFRECSRYREAAFLAQRLFPGPIGAALADPLMAAAEFGYRLCPGARVELLVAALEDERRKRGQV